MVLIFISVNKANICETGNKGPWIYKWIIIQNTTHTARWQQYEEKLNAFTDIDLEYLKTGVERSRINYDVAQPQKNLYAYI